MHAGIRRRDLGRGEEFELRVGGDERSACPVLHFIADACSNDAPSEAAEAVRRGCG